jgi:hypothetical protein
VCCERIVTADFVTEAMWQPSLINRIILCH